MMKRTLRAIGVTAAASLALATTLGAQATRYTYTGLPMTVGWGCPSVTTCLAYPPGTTLTGWVEYSSPLPNSVGQGSGPVGFGTGIIDFRFDVGRLTVTKASVSDFQFGFATDASGNVDAWNFSMIESPADQWYGIEITSYANPWRNNGTWYHDESQYILCATPRPGCAGSPVAYVHQEIAGNSLEPGSWVISTESTVPEPGSLLLLASGLVGIATQRKMQRRKIDPRRGMSLRD